MWRRIWLEVGEERKGPFSQGQEDRGALCHESQWATQAHGICVGRRAPFAGSTQEHLPVTRTGKAHHFAILIILHMFKDYQKGGRAESKHWWRLGNRKQRVAGLQDSLRGGKTPIYFHLPRGTLGPCHFTCGPSPLTAGTAILFLKFSCSFASLHTAFSACSEAWLMLLSKGQTTSGFCSISTLLPDLLRILRPRCKIKTTGNLRRQEFQPRYLA